MKYGWRCMFVWTDTAKMDGRFCILKSCYVYCQNIPSDPRRLFSHGPQRLLQEIIYNTRYGSSLWYSELLISLHKYRVFILIHYYNTQDKKPSLTTHYMFIYTWILYLHTPYIWGSVWPLQRHLIGFGLWPVLLSSMMAPLSIRSCVCCLVLLE